MENNNHDIKFSEQAIESFITLAKILKETHIRLITEGYIIQEGKIIPPDQATSDDGGDTLLK